ncbi:Cyclin-G-associated kinase [Thelohanellus kitauei]|uniref:Cyclin-G-associated kinase n=1 Tax=Thelohanellus kitauei TaxID=669202 RepID=A0A0C2MR19_THEKT|nr:Cyclin-G-associated kinase [Thelohanellus kitauei]
MLFSQSGMQTQTDSAEVFVEFKNIKVKLVKKIGQGKFSYVYSAIDESSSVMYSVKQAATNDHLAELRTRNEITNTKKLQSSHYIIKYYDDARYSKFHFILYEYCPVTLANYVRDRENPLSDEEIVKICGQITGCIEYLHSQVPPLINRGFGVEDVLVNQSGLIKLCNFHDMTSVVLDPSKLDHKEKCEMESKIDKTNPCYMAPEILDLYLNYAISEKADIWALGCIYYFVCKFTYPFNPGKKNDILNVRYTPIDIRSKEMSEFVNNILVKIFQIFPAARPSAFALVREWQSYAEKLNINIETSIITQSSFNLKKSSIKFPRTKVEFLKPANILESLKETGNKIREQIITQNIKKRRVKTPIEFITSRIALSQCPSESTDEVFAEQVAGYLNENHNSNYILINLINSHNFHISLFENRVITYDMHNSRVPTMEKIFDVLTISMKYLAYDPKRIIVFHDDNNGYISLFMVSVMLLYSRAYKRFKRLFEKLLALHQNIEISPVHCSYIRYGEYVEILSYNPGVALQNSLIHVPSITISPVILCNRSGTGCRPFITVELNDNLVFSTLSDPNKVRFFEEKDKNMEIDLDVTIYGNVRLTVYHISFINQNYFQKKLFSIQIHTAFLKGLNHINFHGSQLDFSSPRYLSILYETKVELKIDAQYQNKYTQPDLRKGLVSVASPQIFFSGQNEFQTFVQKIESVPDDDFLFQRLNSLIDRQVYDSERSSISNMSNSEDIKMPIPTAKPKTDSEPSVASSFQKDLLSLFQESYLHTDKSPSKEPPSLTKKHKVEVSDDLINLGEQSKTSFSKVYSVESLYESSNLSSQIISPESSKTLNQARVNSEETFSDIFNKINLSASSDPKISQKPSKNPFDTLFAGKNNNFTKEDSPVRIMDDKPSTFDSNIKNLKPNVVDSSKTRKPDDAFQDILRGHGFVKPEFSTHQKPSLSEVRKRQEVLIESDPISRSISNWTRGKNKNIKLLLSTFGSVIWCPEKWKNVSESQLHDYESVKKAFRNACLIIHPDKIAGSEHEELAKAIFCELSEAWKLFERKHTNIY